MAAGAVRLVFPHSRKCSDYFSTLVYAAGQGDGKSRGLNYLAHAGLVEITPGIDLQSQILDHVEFAPPLKALQKMPDDCFMP